MIEILMQANAEKDQLIEKMNSELVDMNILLIRAYENIEMNMTDYELIRDIETFFAKEK